MTPRHFFFFAASLAAAVSACAQPTPPASTIIVSGELTREYPLNAGAVVEGQLVLKNTAATPGRAQISVADYQLQAGEHVYSAPGQHPRSNALWIEIRERQPELAAGETRIVPYKLTIPAGAAKSGTYWSMILVEGFSPDTSSAATGVAVRSVVRYGIQIITHVGAEATARPAISHQAISLEKNRRLLCFDLANTGERWLQPKLEVRLFDGQGRPLDVLPASKVRVYPGASARQRFDLTRLSKGDYLALIVLDSDDELYGAQYRFRIED
jgi:hypothetical protein